MTMWFKFISHIRFLLKSTNEHGVHSPFVFRYVTQCLYSKKKFHEKKLWNVLFKSIDYFNVEHMGIEDYSGSLDEIKGQFPKIRFDHPLCDLMVLEHLDNSRFEQILAEGKLHNDSMILVPYIHESKKKWQRWNALIAIPEISVSIDMYHCGALFIRREQVKEHFTIRI